MRWTRNTRAGLSGTAGTQAQPEQARAGAAAAAASALLTRRRGVLRQEWRRRAFRHSLAPRRGRHSGRREDGRLERLSSCRAASRCKNSWAARMAASGRCIRKQQPQATCASRADDGRRRALQQGHLRRPGRSRSRSWRARRGRPADEMRLRRGRTAEASAASGSRAWSRTAITVTVLLRPGPSSRCPCRSVPPARPSVFKLG